MKIQIEANPDAQPDEYEGDTVRCGQLLRSFVAETYVASLMREPEVQRYFAGWMARRQSNASRETLRNELKKLHKMAGSYPELSVLEAELEKQIIDTRNRVAKKSVKVGISRMIDERFIWRMQSVLNDQPSVTEPMRNGFVVFSATLMTGVRPTEWWKTQLFGPRENDQLQSDHPTLRVQTGKVKAGETPRVRNLILEDFEQAQLGMIEMAIETVRPMSAVQLGYLSNGLRRVAAYAVEGPEEESLLEELELASARKLFAVEALRDNRSKKQVAGALGHTSDGNLRHYSEGDIYCERKMRYPLARISKDDEGKVKEHLKEFLASRQQEQEAILNQTDPTPKSG
ncbi:hypothetical protein EZI54_07310 [Marinobacter halodurans]|uniref:Site-specific integrase n=1 Tax=Marinobacter halodurans TaxID=2528979 RepID=A0ABY1ZMS5_9GAMM|nr:hypothetical protein [Marinobacter halodurans]TBW57459.1 hypothetical protein EZI54_07310 [Marinobacter halodurans]